MRVPLVIAAIVLLLAALAFIVWRRRRPSSSKPSVATDTAITGGPARTTAESGQGTAARAAHDALARIENEIGRERGLQLAQIARRFLTEAYGVPAMTSTSSELAELLRRREIPTERWQALLDALDAVRIGGPTAIDDLERHLRAALT